MNIGTGKKILPSHQKHITKQANFTNSALGKALGAKRRYS